MQDNDSSIWAKNLAKALKKWFAENQTSHQFKYLSDLATVLSISKSNWKHIMGASTIVGASDPTIYARIYKFTGTPESDPRTLPPLIRIRYGGAKISINRAWTTQQYIQWLNNNG